MEKSLSMGMFYNILCDICILYVLWYMGNEWNNGATVPYSRWL